ncbi:MAG: hypothetical protein MZU79_06300 [Anaerotruncus sp.]|nr:hypothetical protein [Anaerotruncus sp.]
MVGGLIAANSSTILTHLNWGASYLVHDFYRRFIDDGRQREALRRWRAALATVGLFLVLVGDGLSCSTRPRTPSTSSCRSAPARACSTWCAGSGGASTPGARSWRWSARSCVSLVLLVLAQDRRPRSARTTRCSLTIAVTTVCWVVDGLPRPADRPRDAGRVLHEGPPVRPGLEGASAKRSGHRRRPRRARAAREHPAGAARLGRRAAR